MPVQTSLRLRRGTAAQWTSANPVLSDGEPGVESDTGNIKVGDGTTAWSSLSYALSSRYVPQADNKIWLDAADMSVCSGSPTNGPWTSTRWNVWSLDAAISESVSGGVFIPSWWTTYHVDIVWGNDGAGSGDVRFLLAYWDMDAGDNAAADWLGPTSLIATAGLNEIAVVSRILTSHTYAIGKPCKFQLFRDGGNAADTLTNDCAVAGLLFTRAS